MLRLTNTACCALALLAPWAAHAGASEFSGQLRTHRIVREVADSGPLAQANQLRPGTTAVDGSTSALQLELRGNTALAGIQLHAGATLDAQQTDGTASGETRSRINEAYAAGALGAWQWSAGKKVVSWDVGYGFRPNDLVQQEVRRTLAAEPLEGRPLLMAEHFDADTAWSLVWVNPTEERSASGAREAALAARGYWRAGAVDWHGFARRGEHTGSSVGTAVSWVASDALELHASLRGDENSRRQWLIGGTWTAESQLSLLAEAWHDDMALTDAQWSAWSDHNQALPLGLAHGMPTAAVAGALASQARAFSTASNLRQDNVFLRLSWQHERWQPALDVLYTPADQGFIATASVQWTGEHIKLEMGLRAHGGPENAIARQLPVQRQGYVVATWAF
ncbi:MAG: hypothetical protein WAW34_06560 [Rhodoferax sp.]